MTIIWICCSKAAGLYLNSVVATGHIAAIVTVSFENISLKKNFGK